MRVFNFFSLIVSLLMVQSVCGSEIETVLTDGKDSLIVLHDRIPAEVADTLPVLDFSMNSTKMIEQRKGILVLFNDQHRRVLDRATRFEVFLNEKKFETTELQDVLLKNPGVGEVLNLRIIAFSNQDTLFFAGNKKGTVKLSIQAKADEVPVFTDDRIVFGILFLVLALIFYSSSLKNHRFWTRFYTIIPALFLCYFIPAILTTFGIISNEHSKLYPMARDYLLPASLILMTLSIDVKGLINLGPKSLIMFATGTVGIILGGVGAVWIFSLLSPSTVGGEGNEATWRGLATLAGSWIGGGANQTAMFEIYKYKESLYGAMITVDIVVANIWMAVVLFGIEKRKRIDNWLKADNTAIEELIRKMDAFQLSVSRKATVKDYMIMAGLVFGVVSFAHFSASNLSSFFAARTLTPDQDTLSSYFFWLVVLATVFGFLLSFTKARNLEGVGASKIGSVFIYILVVTIGMKMDITKIFDNELLILVGIVWMLIHVGLLVLVAKLIKAPYFFLAVGSQANVGGAASAPIVAGAFHSSLTTVGVIMAVFGYFVGTVGAIACAEWMKIIAP
jgi:uncharacterized membrane protein